MEVSHAHNRTLSHAVPSSPNPAALDVDDDVNKAKTNRSASSSAPPTTLLGALASILHQALELLWIHEPASSTPDIDGHLHRGGGGSRKSRSHLSKSGYIVCFLLLVLGLYELGAGPTPVDTVRRKLEKGSVFQASVANQWKLNPRAGGQVATTTSVGGQADTTAIVLHWKRTENVVKIVSHLCQYTFFDSIFIWNNNPDLRLTHNDFSASQCPTNRLRIYNSPQNLYFFARYLACSFSTTPNCFFQDDDWIVRPIRALYAQFSRDPEGPVVVHTNPDTTMLYGLEWCFYKSSLHTCFSWVGTGAFTAKSHVTRYLSTISTLPYTREELGHADNSFTTFQNEPPYVLSGDLEQLPAPHAHSSGEGIARNKRIIQQGLAHLVAYLARISSTPIAFTGTLLTTPNPLPQSTSSTPFPPLPPYPHSHHARSPSHTDDSFFITNIQLLPPPHAIPYPGPSVGLEKWENHLGSFARGWEEDGGGVWIREERWARRWNYAGAVDGRAKTAFRSNDVMAVNDYIGLGLLSPLDSHTVPNVRLHFTLEDALSLIPHLVVEVSIDGYHWTAPRLQTDAPQCRQTRHRSTLPECPLPLVHSSSQAAIALHAEQTALLQKTNRISLWWRRTKQASVRLVSCSVGIESGDGWRFVRLRAKEGIEQYGRGWGVYEIRVT